VSGREYSLIIGQRFAASPGPKQHVCEAGHRIQLIHIFAENFLKHVLRIIEMFLPGQYAGESRLNLQVQRMPSQDIAILGNGFIIVTLPTQHFR
jgi:hypothetical protein